MQPLHDYQKQAVDFVLDRLYVRDLPGAGLFLDPGLGKTRVTLEALAFMHAAGVVKHTLIVAPLRVCDLVWPQEVEKWAIPLRVASAKKSCRDCAISLINPESLHKIEPGQFDCLVVDESPKFKTWGTKRMKALRKLLPTISKRIILTGTPAANSLADLHAQVYILDDGAALGKNVTVFRAMYMQKGGWQGKQWILRPDMKDRIVDAVAPLCLRMDAETYLDMPELLTNVVPCVLPPEAMREYKRLKVELLAQLESGDILALNAASAYVKMRQLANGAVYDQEHVAHDAHAEKLDALDGLVDELSGKPVLVFFQFKHDAARIMQRHRSAVMLSGDSSPADTKQIVDDWNAGKIGILLAHPQSTSHGLNMQYGPCRDVVWFGLHNSPEVYDQAIRRIYRQGQASRQVRIHRLLCRDTLEFVMAEKMDGKFKAQEDFINALKAHAKT